MSFLDRFRSPGRRAMSDAGPPDRWVFAAVGVGLLIVGACQLIDALPDLPYPAWLIVPGLLTLAVAILDRDAWIIREALAWLALRQRERYPPGSIPMTPRDAAAWLDDPGIANRLPLERASAATLAGRPELAYAALADLVAPDPRQAASAARLRAFLDAGPDRDLNLTPIRAATAGLDAEERRFQIVSAAWAQAGRDISARRPWRPRLAAVAREFAPYPLSTTARMYIAIPQFAAPIAFAVLTVVLLFVVRG